LVWSGFVVVVLTMGAYTVFQYKGQSTPTAGATSSSQQALPPGASSSSNGQLPVTAAAAAAGDLDAYPDECSLQEEDRRSAMLASVVSDLSWQLFIPLLMLDRPRSASQTAAGRSRLQPVLVHRQSPQNAASAQQQQQQRRHLSESGVGKVLRHNLASSSADE
jgi:hypothetical protein